MNKNEFDIRWFTPVSELDLAGHPTLATAHVISQELRLNLNEIIFHTKIKDLLKVTYNKNLYIRNGSFYLLEVKSLYEGKLWGEKLMPYVMDKYDSIDINDLFDFEVASIIMKKRT